MNRHRSREFPRTADSVPRARAWLAAQLQRIVPAPSVEVIEAAVLGLSETATNAVAHGAGPHFTVTCTVVDDVLTIETLDGGSGDRPTPAPIRPDTSAESGRGLFIVDHVSNGDWEWDSDPAGHTTVRFRLKCTDVDAINLTVRC